MEAGNQGQKRTHRIPGLQILCQPKIRKWAMMDEKKLSIHKVCDDADDECGLRGIRRWAKWGADGGKS